MIFNLEKKLEFNGVHYYMGDDTGLQHSFIDEDVVNGRTYYYAVVSYDAGYINTYFSEGISEIENLLPISPSESPASITVTQGVIITLIAIRSGQTQS